MIRHGIIKAIADQEEFKKNNFVQNCEEFQQHNNKKKIDENVES